MSIYSDFTDEQLATEISELRAALRARPTGSSSVKSVAGEGRRLEFSSKASQDANLKDLLRQAEAELARRNGSAGTAIGVYFG